MPIIETPIEGLKIYEPRVFGDERGYFFESYNFKSFKNAGIDCSFVQDNQSRSSLGVLRGLHYQIPPFAQAKLVRVIEGKVLDVAVDIRPNSRTYGEWFSIVLSAKNKKQLFIPRGFAHGFLVLSETAEFFYKCDNFYSKEHEGGLLYDDPNLNIDWKLDMEKVLLSEKDSILPTFGNHRSF
ncbi:dTDP-4-dehydrorhamnose 3,5-epimerase [Saprospiraceae bacterium]|jgi:dTDP-4-dehydrorhamnose 3,5-epimerase|nr:dTDP-4-dehydrorhamnose 3,5-epimerase [Saprospiraceae bacterium]MDC3220083.1 dTDP-4-dehydrorhamnose 3,5-epimerase [Saprospiraceae bacterium]MDG1432780.1 dTDP-4-dehydrorhamnose 3,5-epimerase [Saprospiraceae bacterium]